MNKVRAFMVLLSMVIIHGSCWALEYIYPCDSKIYCQGPILHAVNEAYIAKDSKDYVDMPLKKSPEETLSAFYQTFPNSSNIDLKKLREFLNDYFNEKGLELMDHTPADWIDSPPAFNNITDTTYKKWAAVLHLKWSKLTKTIKDEVRKKPSHYSIIDIPNPFVVPGGRFREVYYWDAYWIIRGLFHSHMFETGRGMIENYLFLVEKYGFIPNGGRIYYLKRSQPPFLAWMMNDYFEFTKNASFIKQHVHTLEKELTEFWEVQRSLLIKLDDRIHRVFHYDTPTNTPRPESYMIDVNQAKNLPLEDQANLYSNIASSAESGWDFSSRWFQDKRSMRLLKTRMILPVDLNSIMCANYNILSNLFQIAGDSDKSKIYVQKHEICKNTIMKVFYNETHGVWFDYHLDTESHNTDFYPTNLSPLFTKSYHFSNTSKAMKKMLIYLKESKALKQGDGIPTSMRASGQQWDWPNAWAPLVHMTVIGLHNTGDHRLQTVANFIAEHWTRYNCQVYNKTKDMYEKYDIVSKGAGSGGEYDIQDGFGWTNGVILDFLVKYGSNFVFQEKSSNVDDLFKNTLNIF